MELAVEMVMNTYLVEAYNSNIKFNKNSTIIALTPKVCYQFDKLGIKYSIIEDFYDEVELLGKEDNIFKWELKWVERLDELLYNNVEEVKGFNVKLGTIYFFLLKHILDSLIIKCYTVRMLFEKINPSSIIFISIYPKDIPLDFTLANDGKSLYSQIIPILCAEKKISFESVYVKENKYEIKKKPKDLKITIKNLLAKYKFVREIYFFLKYGKNSVIKNKDRLNILLLKKGHNGFEIVKTALKNRHNVYLLSDNQIMKYTSFGPKKYLDIKIDQKNNDNWKKAIKSLEKNNLVKEVNEKCQLEISEMVLHKLKYFISEICPKIFKYFKLFIKFYEKENIDFVITPHEWIPIEFGAIAAANYYDPTRSVCVSHGDSVFAIKYWNITEIGAYNIYITSNKEFKEYFEYQCNAHGIPTKIYCSSHRLMKIIKIKYLKNELKTKLVDLKNKELIIYLPTFLNWDLRSIAGAQYPDTWYYKFQKALIEYFSTKKNYEFVWKGLPIADRINNPIPDFIKDNNFSNIKIATDPFTNHLLNADRIICDYPSTGFYEAIIAGLPTMSLYHKAFKVRKTAVEYFGNLLKLYSEIPEAIRHINNFLNDDPELYKTTLDMNDQRIIEILEKL